MPKYWNKNIVCFKKDKVNPDLKEVQTLDLNNLNHN